LWWRTILKIDIQSGLVDNLVGSALLTLPSGALCNRARLYRSLSFPAIRFFNLALRQGSPMTTLRTDRQSAFVTGRSPEGSTLQKLILWRRFSVVSLLWVASAIASPSQTFKTLASFNVTNGESPWSSLVQGFDGNFYGTAYDGGTQCHTPPPPIGCGTIFKITAGGKLTALHTFDLTDGGNPITGLVQATNGDLYGTTRYGGPDDLGTVFKITRAGKLTTLHSFDGTDGEDPFGVLVQANNGDFYGTTYSGGDYGDGTVFKITTGGKLTTLHSFDSTDGANPWGGLIQATNGDLYGTTRLGGAHDDGTIFKITRAGKLTTLHSFDGTDGEDLVAGLVQATDGDLYGTAGLGGANNFGTVFKITPGGKQTTLHSFNGTDGAGARVLVQATDGNFYGTAVEGGANNLGTIFRITAAGKLTTLHSFDWTDGAYPLGGLVQATNGNFYGTTSQGGGYKAGTIFSLSVGLGPFVETLPSSGKVGAAVIILGTNLTGATSVTFNGAATTFNVVSTSEITTTVPAHATTGTVKVTTPKRTLKSNTVFRVTK
jgi:uncharacterized repeat protein (TIGR03803 family)